MIPILQRRVRGKDLTKATTVNSQQRQGLNQRRADSQLITPLIVTRQRHIFTFSFISALLMSDLLMKPELQLATVIPEQTRGLIDLSSCYKEHVASSQMLHNCMISMQAKMNIAIHLAVRCWEGQDSTCYSCSLGLVFFWVNSQGALSLFLRGQ